MEMKTAIVIVVYNKWCGDAHTCKSLFNTNMGPDSVLIVDNSTKPIDNESYCKENGWMYHSMNGNAGLTKAYNAALLLLKDNVDIIIWADDDTFFPETYFEALRSYACKNLNATVFLPVVKSNEVIVSPCIYTKRAMKTIQSLEELQGQKISGINSGMAVRSSLYQQFKYDEAYFLDYVDHDFMRWCRLNEQEFCVMGQVVLQQTFFAHSNAAKKAKRKRFKIYKKDYSRFQRKCGVPFSQIVNDLLRKFIYEQFISH